MAKDDHHPRPATDCYHWLTHPNVTERHPLGCLYASRPPALVYRDKVREIFGLKDPMVIAVVNEGEHGIFNPASLQLVEWLSLEIKELGYSKVKQWVDAEIWMVRKAEFDSLRGKPLKTTYTRGIKQEQGIWAAHLLEAENHMTRHTTKFVFSNIDHQSEIEKSPFMLSRRKVRGRVARSVVRCGSGMTVLQALVRNMGTCCLDAKGVSQVAGATRL